MAHVQKTSIRHGFGEYTFGNWRYLFGGRDETGAVSIVD